MGRNMPSAFQSRNRESFVFKNTRLKMDGLKFLSRFNPAIENLLFSRRNRIQCECGKDYPFQSRNRESFVFKSAADLHLNIFAIKFQSRNRESFVFKNPPVPPLYLFSFSFNPAIENLLFSSAGKIATGLAGANFGFNPAIENLLFSSRKVQIIHFWVFIVSIPQSRIFCFQEPPSETLTIPILKHINSASNTFFILRRYQKRKVGVLNARHIMVLTSP